VKCVVAISIQLVLLANCAPTFSTLKYHEYEREHEITFSRSVGKSIDAEQRAHFGLFVNVEGFESASFYSIDGGGYEVVIKTTEGTFVAVNRDSIAVRVLRDYINTYDTDVSWVKAFEKKWAVVAYDDLGFPITSHEVNSEKNRSLRCIFGAGCGLLSVTPAIFLGMLMGGLTPTGGDLDKPEVAVFIAVSGIAASVAAGAAIGNKISSHRALKAIKEARKPRVLK
jgi:hypothetical protein